MPTPKAGYYLADGTRVPGTTTIIGRFKESGGLMQWAFQQGKAGKAHLYEEAERAADIGTAAHAMAEAHIKGGDAETALQEYNLPDEQAKNARDAFGAYLNWERHTKLRITEQEMQLVSEEYRFGGTPDALGVIGNETVLLDWKTSNKVYSDMLIQLAAYGQLIKENKGIDVRGFHLCRFAKSHGDFAHHYFPKLDEAWRMFVLLREAYDIDKGLKKRAA